MRNRVDWLYCKNFLFWAIIHLTHWSLYLGNLAALVYIIALQPWYIAMFAITTLGNPLIGGVHCAYNNIENTYRQALGWRLIEQNFLNAVIDDLRYLLFLWQQRR